MVEIQALKLDYPLMSGYASVSLVKKEDLIAIAHAFNCDVIFYKLQSNGTKYFFTIAEQVVYSFQE